MPKSYQPGQRRGQYNQNRKIGSDRYAWVTTEQVKFVVLVGNEKAQSGPDVILFHPTPGRLPDISINLTNLTSEELDAIEEILTVAIKWARPVVELRDKEADNARKQGDDSFSRLYRALPTVVYRKRPQYEHSPSLLGRLASVSDGDGGRSSEGRVRGSGDELAESDSEHRGSEDDGTEANESEVVRTVGFRPALPSLGIHTTSAGEDDRSSDS